MPTRSRICHIATFPRRLEGLQRRVRELLPQVDTLRLYCNEYSDTPQGLPESDKLDVLYGVEDKGSQGKLHWLDSTDADHYYLTCDDDIYYPPNYVDTLVNDLERFRCQVIASYHGGVFDLGAVAGTGYGKGQPLPINRRAKDIRRLHSYMKMVPVDRCVHMTGNGCMCCVPSVIGLTGAAITGPKGSGDDEDLAVFAQKHNIPCVVLRHGAGWLKPDNQVWTKGAMHTDTKLQLLSDTKLKQSLWKLNPYHAQ